MTSIGDETKEAISTLFWDSLFIIIFSAGGNFSSKDTEILQKSTITLILFLTIHKEKPINSLDDIKNAFKINYSEVNFGLPIWNHKTNEHFFSLRNREIYTYTG